MKYNFESNVKAAIGFVNLLLLAPSARGVAANNTQPIQEAQDVDPVIIPVDVPEGGFGIFPLPPTNPDSGQGIGFFPPPSGSNPPAGSPLDGSEIPQDVLDALAGR